MKHKNGYLRGFVLRLWVILGVALLAFAHPPLRAHVVDMSAYAMPDGTLPELCVTDRGADHPSLMVHCPACHLAAEIPTPSPAIAAVWTERPEALPCQRAAQIAASQRVNLSPEARAPPSLTL